MKPTEVKDNPGIWKTFKGKSVTGDTIDHQHLSNVYWFGLILRNTEHLWALDILRERFNGQLLPYRPHVEFTLEIQELYERGFLRLEPFSSGDLVQRGKIVWNGKEAGEIIKPLK